MPKTAQKKTTATAKNAAKKAAAKKKKSLMEKKQHLEFIGSLLTIPFLISVLILNFNSIRSLNNAKLTPTPAPNSGGLGHPGSGFFSAPVGSGSNDTTVDPLATQAPCIKTLGPISITSPNEGDTVSTNPVEVDIAYDDSTHCGAVWSYRVNGGDWSDYDDRSVALYNLPRGSITFDLRVKSIASSDTTSLTRHFNYNGQSTVFPTSASSSAH